MALSFNGKLGEAMAWRRARQRGIGGVMCVCAGVTMRRHHAGGWPTLAIINELMEQQPAGVEMACDNGHIFLEIICMAEAKK